MEEDNNIKESEDIPIASEWNLTDSPYVGGIKMSSSLKKRLKSVRMHSSPIARPSTFTVPVAPRSIKFGNLTGTNIKESQEVRNTYSREDIESAMPEPENNAWDEPDQEITENVLKKPDPVLNEDDLAISENMWKDIYSKVNENNITSKSDLEINENTRELIVQSNYMITSDSEENENTVNHPPDHVMNEIVMNESVNETDEITLDKPNLEKSDSACSYSKRGIKNSIDEPHAKKNENICRYSKEDIENCVDKDKLLEIYLNLKKKAAENKELSRKLKLVQKHHSKNNPDALTDLNKKWLTCTQLALTKLYGMMSIPRSISFENFLIFLQVDLDIVKYNPESDTFS